MEEAAELSRAVEAETERQLLDREAECGRVRAELTEVTEELHRTRERTQQLEGYGGGAGLGGLLGAGLPHDGCIWMMCVMCGDVACKCLFAMRPMHCAREFVLAALRPTLLGTV